MRPYTPLVAMIVGGLSLAFVLGLAAHRRGISLVVGNVLVGVAAGRFTPSFVGDRTRPQDPG
jgi:CPA2 family monovalent cation:H+ antiporter-2